jgi:predicted nuclease with RNAse H fold
MPRRFTRVVGIDLASAAARTGVVVLGVRGGLVEATLGDDAQDASLTDLVDATTVVGVDAPLGWPDDFVRALGDHARFEEWPAATTAPGVPERENLRLRRTDRFVRELKLGSTPLSVSSDLIGVVAMRAASLQSAWSGAWGQREPRDGSGRLVETYPAAALRAWGLLPARGVRYKGGGDRDQLDHHTVERGRLIEAIASLGSSWLVLATSLRDEAVRSDHALDALVCALVALAAKLGATTGVPEVDREVARREGWIHVPSRPLTEVGALLVARGSSSHVI